MRTKNIQELLTVLEDQKQHSQDFLAPKAKISMFLGDRPDGLFPQKVPILNIGENVSMPIGDWAHHQLSHKLDIPQAYYSKMLKESPELLATNVNTWLERASGKYLVRTAYGNVRAVLGDRYKPIANESVVFTVLETLNQIPDVQFTVRECALSDTTMYLKVTSDTIHLMNPEEKDGDPMFMGLCIRNSEVGASRFQADIYSWRQWCSNGAIISKGLSKIHVGRQISGDGEVHFSERTKELDIDTTLSAMNDIVIQIFEPKQMQEMIDRIRAGKELKITEPVIAVSNLSEKYGFNDKEKENILARFGEKTQYGLGNAVTEYARDIKDIEEQIRLEQIGGGILVLTEDEFRRMIIRSEP